MHPMSSKVADPPEKCYAQVGQLDTGKAASRLLDKCTSLIPFTPCESSFSCFSFFHTILTPPSYYKSADFPAKSTFAQTRTSNLKLSSITRKACTSTQTRITTVEGDARHRISARQSPPSPSLQEQQYWQQPLVSWRRPKWAIQVCMRFGEPGMRASVRDHDIFLKVVFEHACGVMSCSGM